MLAERPDHPEASIHDSLQDSLRHTANAECAQGWVVSAAPAARPWWRRPSVLVLPVLLLGLAAIGLWRSQPMVVDAVEVQARPLQRSLQFSGRVQSAMRVEIGSTLTGRVEQVWPREGDRVTAGAPLLRLETDELKAVLAQAEASLRQAGARSASQQAVARTSSEAGLLQAEAQLAVAERELTRTQELHAAAFVSAARLDDARRALDIARAQREAARAQSAANRTEGPETAGVQAQQALAQAAVDAARARLAQATLRAPGPGRVIARQVEPGQIVQPGRALMTLAIDGPTELAALVDERFVGQLQPGQRAKVLADAYPQQVFDARLRRLAPAVDAQRGAVEVIFGVEGDTPAFLREDMTLSLEVVTGVRDSALVLPRRALRAATAPGQAGPVTVLVAVDGRAELREIQLGLGTLDQTEVSAGLAAGDLVLLDTRLAPGAAVRPRTVPAAQALGRGAGDGDSAAAALGTAMGGGAR